MSDWESVEVSDERVQRMTKRVRKAAPVVLLLWLVSVLLLGASSLPLWAGFLLALVGFPLVAVVVTVAAIAAMALADMRKSDQ